MNKLVFANLLHRPLRSIISVLAVAIEVIMMLTIIAIMLGQLTGQKRLNNGIGADLIVRPPNTAFFNGIGGAPISAKLAPVLGALPHVTVSSPVITNLSVANGLEVLWGIDYPTYSRLGPFFFLAGGPFQKSDDVMVDDIFAGKIHHLGDTIPINGRPFHICGIYEHGKGGRKLIQIQTMGQMLGDEGKASVFYLKVDRPENVAFVTSEILNVRGMSNYQVMTMDEWMSLMTPDRIPALNTAMDVVIGIAVVIGFLVIFQAMYTSVLERTREIGILKALGASQLTILTVVLRETAVLSVAGVAVGVATSFMTKSLLSQQFPTLYLDMSSALVAKGAAIALLGSLLGAVYPAWMAARKDPIDALAYE
jgi:putative ABC transport system permease protein